MLVTLLSPVLIVLVAPGVKDSAFPDLHDQQRQTNFLFHTHIVQYFEYDSEQWIQTKTGLKDCCTFSMDLLWSNCNFTLQKTQNIFQPVAQAYSRFRVSGFGTTCSWELGVCASTKPWPSVSVEVRSVWKSVRSLCTGSACLCRAMMIEFREELERFEGQRMTKNWKFSWKWLSC